MLKEKINRETKQKERRGSLHSLKEKGPAKRKLLYLMKAEKFAKAEA